jgi:mono/diheme cytochrome c family protein
MEDVMWQPCRAAALGLSFFLCAEPSGAAEIVGGKALLERSCGRCHALVAGTTSPHKQAPNLWDVLRSYPEERLRFELSEGIGSRHRGMPQIQFSSEEITSIQDYLFGEAN